MKTLLADLPLGRIEGTGRFNPNESGGSTGASFFQIDEIFSVIVSFLTIVAGLAFLIYFIIGALNWIMAGGDSKKVDTAKSYMTNGAIGMIIIAAAYSIVWIVGKVLGIEILTPGNELLRLFY